MWWTETEMAGWIFPSSSLFTVFTRVGGCDGYGCDEAPFLKGAFFVCVDCFKKHIHFYLCTFCYRYGKYTHSRRHTNFEDNCMLLQDMILPPYSPDQTQAVAPSQPATTQNYQGALVVATQSVSTGQHC